MRVSTKCDSLLISFAKITMLMMTKTTISASHNEMWVLPISMA